MMVLYGTSVRSKSLTASGSSELSKAFRESGGNTSLFFYGWATATVMAVLHSPVSSGRAARRAGGRSGGTGTEREGHQQ